MQHSSRTFNDVRLNIFGCWRIRVLDWFPIALEWMERLSIKIINL